MGTRNIQSMLITGAIATFQRASRKGESEGSLLARLFELRPPMPVAIVLPNKMVGGTWTMGFQSNPLFHGSKIRIPLIVNAVMKVPAA